MVYGVNHILGRGNHSNKNITLHWLQYNADSQTKCISRTFLGTSQQNKNRKHISKKLSSLISLKLNIQIMNRVKNIIFRLFIFFPQNNPKSFSFTEKSFLIFRLVPMFCDLRSHSKSSFSDNIYNLARCSTWDTADLWVASESLWTEADRFVVVDVALGVGAAVAGVHTVSVKAGESLQTIVIALTPDRYLS